MKQDSPRVAPIRATDIAAKPGPGGSWIMTRKDGSAY
jgi:hypothetical protein